MWKILIGFAAFSALALYILTKSGADVDISGEKHSVEAPEAAPVAASAVAPASAASN